MTATRYKEVQLIFGGTFNPIHYGHLNALLQIAYQLPTQAITLIPCGNPPHKNTNNNNKHQFNMLKLALNNNPPFPYPVQIEPYEINKEQPSYTIETLKYLSQKNKFSIPLILILGMDSYLNFIHWHQWEKILTFCHLAIIPRPQYNKKNITEPKLLKRETNDSNQLLQEKSGKIWLAKSIVHLDISSTYLRKQIRNNKKPLFLLPNAVLQYLLKHNLYSTQ